MAAGWRLIANIPRYDRRPVVYAVGQLARPVAIMGFALVLLGETSWGLRSAIDSYGLGSAVSVVFVMVLVRKDIKPAFVPRFVGRIYRLGASMVGVALSFFMMQS